MDNNVLRSSHFNQIIDDIIAAGFGKGAYYINPKTGKKVQRYVDFNQGLDAMFLNEAKAKRLGEIALRPARVAFDHIEDKDTYERQCVSAQNMELPNSQTMCFTIARISEEKVKISRRYSQGSL